MTDDISPLDRETWRVRPMWRRLSGIWLIFLIGFLGVATVVWFRARGEATVRQSHSATAVQDSRNATAKHGMARALRHAVLASRDAALAPVAPGAHSQPVTKLQAAEGGVAHLVEIRKRRSLPLGIKQDTAPASAEETTRCATLPPLHRLCRN